MLPPGELVEQAARAGVTALALTDHDTCEGIAEAQARGRELGVEVLPGIELSVSENDGARQLHVLGYGIDPAHPALEAETTRLRSERQERGRRIVEKLRARGLELDYAEVEAIAQGTIGRPHVARVLVQRGLCRDSDDAFARYLRRGCAGFVPSPGFSARAAIELVHTAGGVASLAHPPLSSGINEPGGLAAFVSRLVLFGLDGLEVEHPSHTASQRRKLRRIAREHSLLTTGGSDFHGSNRPGIRLGRGRGDLAIPREVYDALLARIGRTS
jgi:3',5'-nucleoside bisphosphate phosphatase